METLTESITRRAGKAPVSYRAGRFGFSAEHIPVLESLGYKVDCSVTPLVSWIPQNEGPIPPGAPDFSTAPTHPYFLDRNDVCRAGDSTLLEVPVTILYLHPLMGIDAIRRQAARIRKLRYFYTATELLSLDPLPRWFRPLPDMTAEKLAQVYHAAMRRRLPVVELMFHSRELMPGASPYN